MIKETYFSSDTIEDISKTILKELQKYHSKHKLIFPKRSALIILDMQEYFLNPISHAYIPSSSAILKPILALKRWFLNHQLPVIQIKHINTPTNALQMDKWWQELLTEAHLLSKIVSPLEEIEPTYNLNKSQYDAFYNTQLESILKMLKIDQLVITGVMTHLCCDTTARSAFVRGFEILFPVDATATYCLNFHKNTFMNLSHGVAIPILTNALLNEE